MDENIGTGGNHGDDAMAIKMQLLALFLVLQDNYDPNQKSLS